jgi:hypothetical protein
MVTLWGFSEGLAPCSLGSAPIVKEPGGMYVSMSPIPVATRLGGGNGRQPEQQTVATRSKMKASSEEWRIGRMCRKAGCERLGAQVRNRGLHGSRALKSLKFPMARGQIFGLVRHLKAGVAGEKSSDCRDHRVRLDASGNADCDDYPDWGTSLRPIRSPTCG